MKAYRLILATTFVLSSSALATAQSLYRVNPGSPGQKSPRRLEASGFVGGMSISHALGTASNIYMKVTGSAQNVSFGKLYGLRASWAFAENLAAEFNFSSGRISYTFDVDDGELGNVSLGEQFNAKQTVMGGNVVFQYPLEIDLVPYATGGAGYLKTTPWNPVADTVHLSAIDINFGGGVKYFFTRPHWLGLRFDLRYHTGTDGLSFAGDDSSPSGTAFTVGAIARFF